jgi:diguanylate cyclase (GGDEF)-like protein
MKALRAWFAKSLSARIVLLFLGLLLLVQGLSYFAIGTTIDRNARTTVAEDLEVGERLLKHVLEQNAQKLTEGATLLAADPGLRSAVSSHDAAALSAVLSNHGDRLGASVAAVLDTRFHLRASAQADAGALQPVMAHLTTHRGNTRRTSDVVMIDNKPFQFAVLPLHAPVIVGWVVLGFPVDQHLIDEMRSLSSLQMSLQVRPDAQTPWKTTLSTLPRDARDALERHPPLISEDDALSLTLPQGEYSAHAVALTDADGPAASMLLMRSVDEAIAPYHQLRLALVALTVLSVALFGVGSVLTARHVTQALRRLGAAAERLGAGDCATPIGGQRRTDEVGELAQAFERMRVNVAGQQEATHRLAYWDSLTGLSNRVQFRNAVVEAMALGDADRRSVAVIMLDLNRFKHVNEVLGYRFGDLLLKGVAERLSQHAVRNGDLVARLGCDEFAVLLADLEPASDLAHTRSVAQRLHAAFDDVMVLEDQTVDTNASFGMAVWPHHASDADTLLNRAEMAMYSAKRRSEGPVVYDPAIDAASNQTLSLLSELHHAVDHHELRLYLQPKLALANAAVVGAEALLRWQHPQRGLVSPMSFIPLAEQTGFIRVLTQWVFEESARTWRMLHESGMRLVISIKLSTRDLLDVQLPQKFETLLVKHIVPAEAFCLEVTESAIMEDPQRAMTTLERLSGMGFRLSIDDFGTGYSSLAQLKRLPVDELKIDKSFVLNMEKDINDARIVRSTIDLAHGLGLSVVAEGVENAQAWNLLRELSCDEAQGFHMGPPMPATQFAWTARHAAPGLKAMGTLVTNVTLH